MSGENMSLVKRVFFICALLLSARSALAQTWSGLGGNDNWGTIANWTPGAPANNGTANLIFGGVMRLTPNVEVPYNVNSIVFNNTAGAFSISGSALTIGSGGIINNDTDMQTISSSVIMSAAQTWAANSGPLTFNSAIQLNSNTLLFSAGAGSSIISGSITSSGGGITKAGGGTLTLSGGGNNTFTGPLTVNAGTVIFNKSPGLRAFNGALTIGDGSGVDTVQYAANNQSSLPSPIVNSSGVLDLNGFTESYQNITINGGSLTIDGGVLTIGSNVIMTGGSISSTGVGRLVGQGTYTTNAAATSATISGNIDPQGNSHNFNIADGAAAADLDISASVGNGIINKNGAGTLRFSGSVSSGPSAQLIVNSGTVELAKTGGAFAVSVFLGIGNLSGAVNSDVVRFLGNQQLEPATSISINSDGLLDLNGFNQNVPHVTLSGGNITTGTGSLILIDGPGIASTISAQTATISGHLGLSDGARIITVADGGSSVDLDISAAIETLTPAAGSLTKNGAGTLRLSGSTPNSYGQTTVNNGTLLLNKTVANSAIPGNLIIGDATSFATVRLESSNQIADSSNIIIRPNAALDLNGQSDTVGAITIAGNTEIVTGGGTLTVTGNISSITAGLPAAEGIIIGNLALSGTRILTVENGASSPDFSIPANISGGTLLMNGPGELFLSGNNTAQFVLNAGTISFASNTAFGTGPLTLNGGTLIATNTRTLANLVSINGPVTVDGAGSLTLNGAISGNGALHKNGSGSLILVPGSTIPGPWTLNSGTLSSTDLRTAASGSLTMNGGVFSGQLINSGNFIYNNGTFSGTLVNQGSVTINNSSFDISAELANFADLHLNNGQLLTVGSHGIANTGQISMAGSTISSSGQITNFGSIVGFGELTGSGGIVNNGLIVQGDGTLSFNSSGGQTNLGNIDMAQGRVLQISSAGFNNLGTINLNGGLINGPSTFVNSVGATVVGRGTIFTQFANGGILLIQDGNTRISNPQENFGTIQLAGAGASLTGGPFKNSGTIQGAGSIGNNIDNSGAIEALGGTLIFAGSLNNNGTIAASTGNKILINSGSVFGINSGVISLTGGTFDNTVSAVINSGQISGYGTFRAGLLTNNGSITFTGGFTTINGNVTNAATKQIKVAYNPAIFTGNVTNNGIFKNTSTTVTFAGTYTENGTFISDPADNFFSSVNIGAGGAWVGGIGDRFFVSGNFVNQSANSTQWDTAAAELHLLVGSGDRFAVNGNDLGIDFAGYDDNFSWGTLSLAAGRSLTLFDADAAPGGAVYVDSLDLRGGIDQIANITGNGMTLYYHLGNSNNAYLGGKSYQLAGGGSITPVPEPAGILLSMIAAQLLLARRACRRRV